MPNFSYRGRDAGGEVVQGMLDAISAAVVADQLFGQGITPLEIAPAAGGPAASQDLFAGLLRPKATALDVLLFSRQIHTLLKAGVPIMRALTGLQESGTSPAMQRVIQDVRSGLDAGRELSVGFSYHPQVFSIFYISMVRVAELTGRLEEVFLGLYHHLEFEKFMRDQIKSALRYPSFVVAAMAAAIVIVNIWVIPVFAKVFKGLGAELPVMTRILIGFSDFMVGNGWLLLIAAVGAVFAFGWWTASAAGRPIWDRFKLTLPVAGKIVRKATMARFARSFALAVRSGVPLVQGLAVVAQTVDNAFISARIDKMREGVERGESILKTAGATGVFTPIVLQMISVGEESGALDDMMQEIADMYQSEVEYELKTLSQQIEPILIVFLGVLVLILALGIFLPIWDLGKVSIKR
jgi:MSHA biogenesis protein MshG